MIAHITAITQTLMIFLFLGAAYFGWGRIASHILGIARQAPDGAITPIWLGWACTLFIFQALHFFLPVTAYVVVTVFAAGVIFSIPQAADALRHFFRQRPAATRAVAIVVIVLAVAGWVASRAMLPPANYDSGLYHLNAIRWLNTYSIVPGLGNLHGRLAYNQSFFTYVAALNFHPFLGYGRSFANSFLLLLTMATALSSLRPVLQRPSLLTDTHPFLHASGLFALPVIGYLALSSDGLASPSPDLASTLLQLVMFIMLARGIAKWMNGGRQQDHGAMVLAVLAATAVTVKLSNLAFAAVVISLCLAYAWRASPNRIQGAARILLPVSVVILVWGFRGFILSGAPLYPSTIGYVPVDWAVPAGKVVNEANWIYSWARQPGIHWSKVLGSWEWFGPWRLRLGSYPVEVIYPLAVSAAFCIIALIIGRLSFSKSGRRPRYWEWSILLPSAIGLVYWFFTAPDPRFAHALFWLLTLGSALLLLSTLQTFLEKRALVSATCMVFVVANLHFVAYAVIFHDDITSVSTSGWHPVRTVRLTPKTTSSGLVVYTPESGDQCWDAPLPSTPYFNADLRLRSPGNLASGFTVTKAQKHADHDVHASPPVRREW